LTQNAPPEPQSLNMLPGMHRRCAASQQPPLHAVRPALLHAVVH
jgi:hypothetical protein